MGTLLEVAKVTILYRLLTFSIMAGISIYFFWLYATHHNRYCQRNIALWLVVTAATAIGTFVLEVVLTFACITYRIRTGDATQEKLKEDTNKRTRYLAPLFLFAFAWFIVGNVWVFKTKKQDCDELVWMTGFWYLIALYILIGGGMIVACCVGCCVAVIFKKK